jgi:hypothetical protein
MTYSDLVRNNYVSFNLYPNGTLTNTYTNVKILSPQDMDDAKGYIDPIALHANILPLLPPNTPKNPADFPYYKIQLADGTITSIAEPWIQASSIVVQNTAAYRFTVEALTPSRFNALMTLMSANDFTAVQVETLN